MKAVCVADIHGDVGALIKLRNAATMLNPDYFFLLGDYSRGYKDPAENRADIKMILDALTGFNVKAIPGNCDQRESVQTFVSRGANLHNTVMMLPGLNIIGFGGSNATPFATPFEYSEADIAKSLNDLYDLSDKDAKTIVVAHFPPKDTKCDVIAGGVHVGSQALRDFIDAKRPELVLCAHIHEAGGLEDNIKKTKILNLGRLSDGRAYVLDAGDEINVEFFVG
ncbi:MAG: metallophosphoesterase [Candidatus Altiarchaeota archaeon]